MYVSCLCYVCQVSRRGGRAPESAPGMSLGTSLRTISAPCQTNVIRKIHFFHNRKKFSLVPTFSRLVLAGRRARVLYRMLEFWVLVKVESRWRAGTAGQTQPGQADRAMTYFYPRGPGQDGAVRVIPARAGPVRRYAPTAACSSTVAKWPSFRPNKSKVAVF